MTANHQSPPDATTDSLAAARAEYQEYYAVQDTLEINVIPLPESASLPSQDLFLQQAPAIFKLASELQVVDASALSQLRSLGPAADVIAEALNQQNRKLTALLSYLLRNEDDPEHRTEAFEYGGAGVGFSSSMPITEGQLIELKMFFPAESAAAYSIAQVVECSPAVPSCEMQTNHSTNASASAAEYRIRALFKRISDNDRELLIRACMHAQSRLLKKRANARSDTP